MDYYFFLPETLSRADMFLILFTRAEGTACVQRHGSNPRRVGSLPCDRSSPKQKVALREDGTRAAARFPLVTDC